MNEDQKRLIVGIVAALAVVAAIAMYFVMFPPPPKTLKDAGIGTPAKPGGGVEEGTPYGPGGMPQGPGGTPPTNTTG